MKTPLKYRLNPCDIDRLPKLKPLGGFFALFAYGTDCTCCLGARIAAAFSIGIIIGYYL